MPKEFTLRESRAQGAAIHRDESTLGPFGIQLVQRPGELLFPRASFAGDERGQIAQPTEARQKPKQLQHAFASGMNACAAHGRTQFARFGLTQRDGLQQRGNVLPEFTRKSFRTRF